MGRGHRIRQHGHVTDLLPGHPAKYTRQEKPANKSTLNPPPGHSQAKPTKPVKPTPGPKPQPNRRHPVKSAQKN